MRFNGRVARGYVGVIRVRQAPPRRRLAPSAAPWVAPLLALPLALLLACERPAADPPREGSGAASGTEPAPAPDVTPAAGGEVALGESCTNDEYGFRVEYPTGWVTNSGDVMPPCTAFDPRDVELPAASEIPAGIAIVITREEVGFGQVTGFAGDPSVEVLSEEEATVDGRRAIVAELEHTGAGLYDAGHRQFAWYVDVGPHTLIGVTHATGSAGPPSYAERQRILRAMMEGLTVLSSRPGADAGTGSNPNRPSEARAP